MGVEVITQILLTPKILLEESRCSIMLHQTPIERNCDLLNFFTTMSQKVSYLKNRVESLSIPAAKKADIKTKIVLLQEQVRKAQKQIAEENKRKAVKLTTDRAELAASNGKAFCISRVDVGLDVVAVREAVMKVMEQKELSVMVFSTDEATNKAVVCAGVPEKGDKGKLDVSEWLSNALGPLKGRCGKGKNGLATGQETLVLLLDVGPSMHHVLREIEKVCSMLAEKKMIYSKYDEVGIVLFGAKDTDNELTKEVGGYKHVMVLKSIKVVDGDIVEALQQLPKGTTDGDCIR
ncbi:alanine--tRNA ligase isoform X1 [Senna tora]|uniref:Alanine--tRNA ligase isoform X1 n=1 Tax=Senna tora TaxID=362788 RepID=A0A834VYL3_9FABA|nr:alanine--tRNA ligase isoform X1 [Senna tora]